METLRPWQAEHAAGRQIIPVGWGGAGRGRRSPVVEELAYKHNLFSPLILKIMISGLFHLFKCLT